MARLGPTAVAQGYATRYDGLHIDKGFPVPLRMLAVASVAVLVAVGCAEGGGDTTQDTVDDPLGAPQDRDTLLPLEPTSTEDPVGQLGTSDDAAPGPTVEVQAIAFEPESVTVAAGTPVTWVSRDDVAHTVTSGSPVVDPDVPSGIFDEDLPAGGSATVTIDEPGTYPYYCEIHQGMTARLVVE